MFLFGAMTALHRSRSLAPTNDLGKAAFGCFTFRKQAWESS